MLPASAISDCQAREIFRFFERSIGVVVARDEKVAFDLIAKFGGNISNGDCAKTMRNENDRPLSLCNGSSDGRVSVGESPATLQLPHENERYFRESWELRMEMEF